MSKIKITFEKLKELNKSALIPFITAGDPSPTETVSLMNTLVENGADMIELGIPFSDPMADGPVIQRASERALKNKVGIKKFRVVFFIIGILFSCLWTLWCSWLYFAKPHLW